MSEDDKREGVDDLFGDLDEFFAPIDDVEWPEKGQEEAPPATPAGDEPEGGAPAEDWDLDLAIPRQEELVGEQPEARPEAAAERETEAEEETVVDRPPEAEAPPETRDAEELEEETEPEPAPVSEEAEPEREPAPLSEETAEPQPAPVAEDDPGEAAPESSEPGDLESTAEMSGDDWDRLRSVLAEEDAESEEEGAPGTPDEGPRELTVDDLRGGPDEYADLSPSPEPATPEEPRGEAVEEWEGVEAPEEPVLPEAATFAAEGPVPPPRRPQEDASPDEVEAAAAHFAAGLEPDEVERDLLSDLDADLDEEAEPPAAPPPAAAEPEDAGEEEGVEVAPAAPPIAARTEEDEEEEPLVIGGEGAPTWQEPAAYVPDEDEEVPAEAGAPPGGRNLGAAVASGVILAIAAIALLAIGKGPFVVLAIGIVLLGQGELYDVMRKQGFQPATAIGLLAGLFVMVGAYTRAASLQGEGAMLFGLAIGLMLSILWYMVAPPASRRGLVQNVGATMLGVVYVPFLVSFALLLLAVPGDVGTNLLLTVVGLTVLYDVCAYAIGTLWGNRPLAPTVSPRKSWEGAIGATFVLLLVSLAIVPSIPPFTASRAVGLALVIAIAAPLGDLAESAIKRDVGVKDMGSLLPGHGGVLDRIDAILFTAPAAYYFLRLVA